MTAEPASNELHVRHISRVINEEWGGDATVEDIVRLMLEIGWQPPTVVVRRSAE